MSSESAGQMLHDWRSAGPSRRTSLFGVRRLDTAGRVQDLLGARGVRCLPLKGAALAERLYDSVAAPLSPALQEFVTAWLPSGLRGYVASRLRIDPSVLLVPAEPPVPRVRWGLAAGYRTALIRETLKPSLPSFSRAAGLGGLGRALGLGRRWFLPTVRSLGARPQK